jgi:putative addiction module killer protein
MNESRPKNVVAYTTLQGKEPFTEWLNNLRDKIGRTRILARITRLEHGHYGDCSSVGDGVSELRIFVGPGYRVYFGEKDDDLIVLLCGGDKGSQPNDIALAKAYWKEYLKT